MAKRVYVTTTQQVAAKMIIERNAASGIPVRSSISKIANASAGAHPRTEASDKIAAIFNGSSDPGWAEDRDTLDGGLLDPFTR